MAEDETIRCAWRGSTVTELRCQATKCDPGLLANCREAKCSRLRPSQLREPRPHPEPDSCGGGGQNTLRAEPATESAPKPGGRSLMDLILELARREGDTARGMAEVLKKAARVTASLSVSRAETGSHFSAEVRTEARTTCAKVLCSDVRGLAEK